MSSTLDLPLAVDKYHADPRVSHSKLEHFRKRRREFHAIRITRTMPAKESSDEQRLGTLVDLLVLTPERWEASVAKPRPALAPDGKKWRRTKGSDHERWDAEWQASCNGKIAAHEDEVWLAKAMRDAVYSSPLAHFIDWELGCRDRAQSIITWEDEATGLACKSMRDLWLPDRNLIVDLKTTDDASPWAFTRQSVRLGYHRQAEFYVRGQHEVLGDAPAFAFIVVASSPPHEVGVYFMDDKALAVAGRQNNEDLAAYEMCQRTGDWREDWEKAPQPLSLPKYAEYE